jgi:O-glycosyl hydrolase
MHFFSLAVTALPTLSFASTGPKKGSKIRMTVDPSEKYQHIEGFGFSGAFQRAQLLLNVTEETQQELFDLIYSTERGVGFSMVRNGVGSFNSSFNDWMNTHQPISPGSPDAEAEYVWDEYDSGQLALSMKAVEYGVKCFYANAWSSPRFMKNNSDDANGGLLCGVDGSFEEGFHCEDDWRQAYAD